MKNLETVEYPATASTGKVAYLIDGQNIYFSSVRRNATSTVNAAEVIVRVLAELAGQSWRTLIFYDIQTHNGYDGWRRGSYEVNRLIIQPRPGGKFTIEDWEPVEMSADLVGTRGIKDVTELPGLKPEVLGLFSNIINDDVQD